MAHRARAILFSLGLTLALPAGAAAAGATLVADVNPSLFDDSFGDSGPVGPLVAVAGGRVVFRSSLASSGTELWASDGTALGTQMLRDLCPGGCSSQPSFLGTVRGRALFFADLAEEGSFGLSELWATDGTRQGTVRLAGSDSEPGRCFDETVSAATAHAVFFVGSTPAEGCEPWVSDGTAAGTRRLRDIAIGNSFASRMTAAGNRVFFGAQDGEGFGLWTSDGTTAGTALLRRFGDGLRLVTPAGSRVFFVAGEGFETDTELWVSDGTAAGTLALTASAAPDPFAETSFLKVLDGALYFVADDITGGQDLWVSDGTPAGTRRVTDFGFASPFSFSFDLELGPEQITRVGGRLLFPATDGLTPRRLWTSGGTPATTVPLEGCGTGGACPEVGELEFVRVRDRVVFAGAGGGRGMELWTSDGTPAGTRLLRDLCRGACSSSPRHFFTAPGGRVFVVATDATGNPELWRTDGTAPSTVRLASPGFDPFPSSDSPFLPVAVGRSRILFLAVIDQFGEAPSELWASDGTPAGTGHVTVLGEQGTGSFPRHLVATAGGFRFVACVGEEHRIYDSGGTPASTAPIAATSVFSSCFDERLPGRLTAADGLTFYLREDESFVRFRLWRTDGTAAGTFQVSPEEIGVGLDPVPFGGGVAFLAFSDPDDDGFRNSSLWASDGTVAGTRQLAELPADFRAPSFLRAVGSELWFTGNVGDFTPHEQLWVSDGTPAGTRQVTDFDLNSFQEPPRPVRLGGTVYFLARNDFGPEELWRTDGTQVGTAPVLPPGFDVEGKDASDLIAFGGALYFFGFADQAPLRRGLFRSDGTAAGTVLLAPVGPPNETFRVPPSAFAGLGDRLLFLADDGVHGVELWVTDGTSAGTRLVRDLLPGPASAFPADHFDGRPPLLAASGRVFFAAGDGVHGVELWQTDGTAAGTRLVQDIAPGALSSNPQWLTASGDRLFFTADDGLTGQEPWVYPLAGTAPACVPSETALCLGNSRFRVEAAWRDFDGGSGTGHAVALTGDTGTFWFFDPANVEVIVKILDGRGTNGHHWVFYGALSSVEYHLTVTDLETGAARRYVNPPGRLASVADTAAFGPQGATGSGLTFGPAGVASAPLVAASRSARQGTCAPSSTRLCLQGGRFAVEATWRDFQGNRGVGMAVPLPGGDTGYFWFFDDDNVEVVLKVLDGRPVNGRFWVFFGALSSVEYTLTVTDTETGQRKEYRNPSGRLASFADTGAF